MTGTLNKRMRWLADGGTASLAILVRAACLGLLLAVPIGLAHGEGLTGLEPSASLDKQACLSWYDHLLNTVSWRGRTGTLDADEERTLLEVVDGIGRRCDGAGAREASALFVTFLDLLTEPENQP